MRFKWILLLVLLWTVPVAAAPPAQTACLPTQFRGDGMENAIVTPGDPNNVREFPSRNAALVGQLAPGTVMNIVYDDAVCAESFLWRHVAALGINGWTPEANATTYFILPYESPAPAVVATAPAQGSLIVDSGGVTFTVPAALGITAVMQEEQVGIFDLDMMGGMPSSVRYTLVSGVDAALNGTIDLYHYHDSEAAYAFFDYDAADLEALLDNKVDLLQAAQSPGGLTNMPVRAAGAIFYGLPQYQPFGNGNGLRYLTVFAQNFVVFSADTPYEYFYRGLSSDDQFLVAAHFPVQVPATILPPEIDPFANEVDYTAYLAQFTQVVDAQAASAFTPNLGWYDALLASLSITDTAALSASIR